MKERFSVKGDRDSVEDMKEKLIIKWICEAQAIKRLAQQQNLTSSDQRIYSFKELEWILIKGYAVYRKSTRKLAPIIRQTVENLETITLMVEITLKKLYEAIIDDPNVKLGSYILFNTINIESRINK